MWISSGKDQGQKLKQGEDDKVKKIDHEPLPLCKIDPNALLKNGVVNLLTIPPPPVTWRTIDRSSIESQ